MKGIHGQILSGMALALSLLCAAPAAKANEAQQVDVVFSVDEVGNILGTDLVKPSGNWDRDSQAVKSIIEAGPFLPLPLGAGSSRRFRASFLYYCKGPIDCKISPEPTPLIPRGDDLPWQAMDRQIKRNWYPPKCCTNPCDNITVSFRVDSSGKATGIKLLRSGGVSFGDAAAIKAIEAARFQNVPTNLEFSYNFRYEFPFYSNSRNHFRILSYE